MSIFTRDGLLEDLRESKCVVSFTKVDGDQRVMYCTLRDDDIPQDKKPKSYSFTHDSVIRTFDLKKQAWRSFRVENVISIHKNPSPEVIENLV